MDWKEKLGEEIRRARNRRGMTQEELRSALHLAGLRLCLNSIGKYERGESAPDFDDLRIIAVALDADHFEIDDNVRIEFAANGKPRPVPPQQLDLDFDENDGVTVRIESAKHGVVIRKMLA